MLVRPGRRTLEALNAQSVAVLIRDNATLNTVKEWSDGSVQADGHLSRLG